MVEHAQGKSFPCINFDNIMIIKEVTSCIKTL